MKVWLTSVNEPTPLDDLQGRLWRTGLTAELLAEQGHDVVWWVSNFRHLTKDFRASEPGWVDMPEGYRMRLLPSLGYRRHISLRRLLDHRYVAKRFLEQAEAVEAPDIVLASFPTVDICKAAVDFGRSRGIPVVVDVRDQWPDTFRSAFPRSLHWLVEILTIPMSRQADHVFRHATAITGNGPGAVRWALERAGRDATELDADFPMGYPRLEFDDERMRDARAFWEERGLTGTDGQFIVAFLGSISRHFDFTTVLDAADLLDREGVPVRFVFCGTGDRLEALRNEAADRPLVDFPGWVAAPELHALLQVSSVGLAPYHGGANFEDGITNKPIEYMSAGLPIATTLERGLLRELLEAHDCGLFYSPGEPHQLMSILKRLRDDSAQLAALRANARALYEGRFTARKVYGAMIEHLENIVCSFRPPEARAS